MVLKAVQPLRVKMPDGSRAFAPGETITLPDWVGQRLVAMAPQKVEVIEPKALQPGVWCEWWHPEYGHCMGQIDRVTVKGYVVTSRSVLGYGAGVEIPVGGINGVYREHQASE